MTVKWFPLLQVVDLLLEHGADAGLPLGPGVGSALCAVGTHEALLHSSLSTALSMVCEHVGCAVNTAPPPPLQCASPLANSCAGLPADVTRSRPLPECSLVQGPTWSWHCGGPRPPAAHTGRGRAGHMNHKMCMYSVRGLSLGHVTGHVTGHASGAACYGAVCLLSCPTPRGVASGTFPLTPAS